MLKRIIVSSLLGAIIFAAGGVILPLGMGFFSGTQHPHGPSNFLMAFLAVIYFAPVGLLLGLIASLTFAKNYRKLFRFLLIALPVCILLGYLWLKLL
jgi:hypothetical protein